MSDFYRRLPVYLLLDCSESMAGDAIEAVSLGVNALLTDLRTDPQALETAYLSVITFSRTAKQEVPLTELLHFHPPKLSVKTGTALGAALRLLSECLKREVLRTTATTKGDYKPLVFILTDGQPTDDWKSAAATLKSARDPKVANIYAIGCSTDVDFEVLYSITDTVLLMPDLSPDSLRKCFVWLSASVQTASASLEGSFGKEAINLPALPDDALTVASRSQVTRDQTPRQVFLHARCSKTKQPYLMRFALGEYEGLYDAVAAHRLESLEDEDADLLPPINSSLLNGCPSCPYCENPIAAMCPCGALFCASETQDSVVCPKCNTQLAAGNKTDFDIKRSQG
jgi:uncharacterized protein YegL